MEDWYKWAPNETKDLDLTNTSLVYVNFIKEATAIVVGGEYFESYLKMDEYLVSNLVKKIDDGTFIKMN